MKRTKIICTLGPSADNEDILKQLIIKGMNVARFNFSHGTHAEHKKRVDAIRKVSKELGRPIPLLLDVMGPKIRTGIFKDGEVTLKENDNFTFVNDDVLGDENQVSVTYKNMYKDVCTGSRILINDGLVELKVIDIVNKNVNCVVLNGGTIGNHKGINIPDVDIHLPSMDEKDIDDIRFGVENDFDFIAASFVRKADDIRAVKKLLNDFGGSDIKVIAKIESREGVNNFDEILEVADVIMVARGDLGVEIPDEEVPVIQKMLIQKCYKNAKPVITATQMLDSMIRNPRPTRAEASDVANAIYDGTSAIMLSGETASGKYPVESVAMMTKIAESVESAIDYWQVFMNTKYNKMSNVTNAISHATCTTAMDIKAAAIITFTNSGHTARMISRFRPSCPIIAMTNNEKVLRQLNISWGVTPILVNKIMTTDGMFEIGSIKALESGMAKEGDLVVMTAGVPVGISGTTNLIKVHSL